MELKADGFGFNRVDYFRIYFSDTNEYWWFVLKQEYEGMPAGMIVYLDPRCVGGCR